MSNNTYSPTPEDRQRILPKGGYFKVSGDKVFATLQGEGLLKEDGGSAGCPAVFFRLHFCNLKCGFKSGWKCDTGYTWDTTREEYWKEPTDWDVTKSKSEIENAWNEKFFELGNDQKRVVVTGGEPLLQKLMIAELVKAMFDWSFEIETNGTIDPGEGLLHCQINCSPKLENSGNPKELRYRPEVLEKINNWSKSWFKFVVVDEEDLMEVEQIVNDCKLKKEKVLIMPEGITVEANKAHKESVEEAVKKHGWRIANRNHIIWFGSKRRT